MEQFSSISVATRIKIVEICDDDDWIVAREIAKENEQSLVIEDIELNHSVNVH